MVELIAYTFGKALQLLPVKIRIDGGWIPNGIMDMGYKFRIEV